ncbi:hypothetical protein EPI10_025216 [Gossypium australe]|uniref:Uncharacterized protein n=1 Tax=Gossypium australe TaxID=47621 RepID=A0A5B6W1B1_9ROSI|nr:hypothetical protein EPI10_025216 [Gossypium australe]
MDLLITWLSKVQFQVPFLVLPHQHCSALIASEFRQSDQCRVNTPEKVENECDKTTYDVTSSCMKMTFWHGNCRLEFDARAEKN